MCMKLICCSSFLTQKCKFMLNRKQASLNPFGEPHEIFFHREPVSLYASGSTSLPYPCLFSLPHLTLYSEQLCVNVDSSQPAQICWSSWTLLHRSCLVLGSVCMSRSDKTSVCLALWKTGDVQRRCWGVTLDWNVVPTPDFKHSSCSSYAYSMQFGRLGSTCSVKLFVARDIIWHYLQIAFLSGLGWGWECQSLRRISPLPYVTQQWLSCPGFFWGGG